MALRKNSGFTLVEILVVLLIIGVILGITLLTSVTGSIYKTVKEESARLQVLFSQIRDKALIENTEYGFAIDGAGVYQWWVLPSGQKQWQPLRDKPFQPYRMPKGLSIQLTTAEDEPPAPEGWHDEAPARPTVVFYSDWECTPFDLSIIPDEDQKQAVTLSTDGLAAVEIYREEND